MIFIFSEYIKLIIFYMELTMNEDFEKLTNAKLGRFKNKKRDYTFADVKKLSGSVKIEHTLAH